MESLPWIRESEHLFGNKAFVEDGDVEISGKEDISESSNAKRKIESLFCVMRKRRCRHKSVMEAMFSDLDNKAEIGDDGDDIQYCLRPENYFGFENLMDNCYDPLDEGSIVDDWSCSGSDTDLSESSEFDVISEHVLQDNDLITGSKSLSLCNFPWTNEDEGTLVSNDTSLFHSERKKDKLSCIPGLCEDILRELGIGIVAYSPLGRGFLASGPKLVENLDRNDFRKALPRFQQENLDHNKIVYEKDAMSEKKGCTPAQLALAWVHHQGDDVCPIPGTTKIKNLNQNIGALSVKLTPEEMSQLESITQPESVKGERYTATMPTFKNSDTPPLFSWKAA